jgi:hypothetical protein
MRELIRTAVLDICVRHGWDTEEPSVWKSPFLDPFLDKVVSDAMVHVPRGQYQQSVYIIFYDDRIKIGADTFIMYSDPDFYKKVLVVIKQYADDLHLRMIIREYAGNLHLRARS